MESMATRPMEAFPPHIEAALDRRRELVLPGPAAKTRELQGLYNKLNRWTAGQPLHACFFAGTTELRQKIAESAKLWEKGTNVRIDFGDMADPRQCAPNAQNEIRIGFGYLGYWSLIGPDSITLVHQSDQSMNFFAFEVAAPSDPEFTGVVLHEFGHALGLFHEHQNPKSTCEKEFDWPIVEAKLAGFPNFWSKEKVHQQMGTLMNDGNIEATDFDQRSIMLYTFDKSFYKKDTALLSCYTEPNFEISKRDRETVNSMYPANPALAQQERSSAAAQLAQHLSALTIPDEEKREGAKHAVEMLASPVSSAADRIRIFERLSAPSLR
jgi:hypothetical protein